MPAVCMIGFRLMVNRDRTAFESEYVDCREDPIYQQAAAEYREHVQTCPTCQQWKNWKGELHDERRAKNA